MGAVFKTRRIPACTTEELRQEYYGLLADLRYERGNDPYGGDWHLNDGLHIVERSYPTQKEAYDYLDRACDKGGLVLAVRVGDFAKSLFPQKKADKDLVERVRAIDQQFYRYEFDILERARGQKSVMKTCDHCQSRINLKKLPAFREKDFIKARQSGGKVVPSVGLVWAFDRLMVSSPTELLGCPVCGKTPFLETATDIKNRDRVRATRDELLKRLRHAREDHQKMLKEKKIEGYWFLGGVSPE